MHETHTHTQSCRRCALPVVADFSCCPWCGREVQLSVVRGRNAGALVLVALGLALLALLLLGLLAALA